jgi:hypothetical protein
MAHPLSSRLIHNGVALLVLVGLSLSLLASPHAVVAAPSAPFELRGEALSLRPRVLLSNSYDTNVFYEASPDAFGATPNDGWLVRFGAGGTVENRNKGSIDFQTSADLSYRHYLYMDQAEATISDKVRLGRNTFDSASLNSLLVFGPRRPLQLALTERLSYIERPVYENSVYGFERLDNRAGVRASFSPGRAQTEGPLAFSLGYELQTLSFLNARPEIQIQGRSEKLAHALALETRWRFLPKNYLVLDVSYASNNYNDFQAVAGQPASAETLSRDSSPLRAQLGLTGLITPRFSVFLKAGYANTFNASGETFSGLIALAELTYQIEGRLRASAGYQRDGRDSGFSNFYTLDRGFLKARVALSERVAFLGDLSFDVYEYSASNAIDNLGRVDPVLRAQARVEVPVNGAISAQIGWSIEANYTTYVLPVDPTLPISDIAQYQRQLFTLTLMLN